MTINLDELKLQFIGEGKFMNQDELREFVEFLNYEIINDPINMDELEESARASEEALEEAESERDEKQRMLNSIHTELEAILDKIQRIE